MNVFQLNYYSRVGAWRELREEIANDSLLTACVKVDEFWQQSPMSAHYLHPTETSKWPDIWQLLDDNVYCPYARAYGMIATLVIAGITNLKLVDARNSDDEDVVLVIVDDRFVLNYWPNSVLNMKPEDFTILRTYDIPTIRQ